MVYGTAGNDVLSLTAGGVFAYGGNDVIFATAQQGYGQIHTYAAKDDDYTFIQFAEITDFSHGHHLRGGSGADDFDFVGLDSVDAVIVGRIEDFDASRDRILIEGVPLDLHNLPAGVRIVSYNGEFNDPGTDPQQWLLIDTGAGAVFYTLEGARVDMDGDGGDNSRDQEPHFLLNEPDFDTLPDVAFIDPVNFVPAGFGPVAGVTIDDTDVDSADVLAVIQGTSDADLIAGGLNDDTIEASHGDDHVWGGSGNDDIFAGQGHDVVHGGTGQDRISGNGGDDTLFGDDGDDLLFGGSGADDLWGGNGDDSLNGGNGNDRLFGEAGDDKLFGLDGDDRLVGGFGRDALRGGDGADVLIGGPDIDRFVFFEFDGSVDVIEDFEVGTDLLWMGGPISTLADVVWSAAVHDGQDGTMVEFIGVGGLVDPLMGGVFLNDVSPDALGSGDFVF